MTQNYQNKDPEKGFLRWTDFMLIYLNKAG